MPTKKLVLWLLVAGCAHTQRVQMDPITFERNRAGEIEVVDPAALFEKAKAAFEANQYADAARSFDRLIAAPDTRYLDPSLYNAGLCYEGLSDWPAAADRYRKLIARATAPAGDLLDAQFRLGAVLVAQKSWPPAAAVYAQILTRADLPLPDRFEALARRGLAQLEANDLPGAEKTLAQPLELFKKNQAIERLDTFFVAMSAFYLAEVSHEQYRRQPLRLAELDKDVEAKATLLLAAEARYLDAMKIKEPEWATAAGSQIASLYREFHDDLLAAPIPPELDAEARQVYADEVKQQLLSLLRRALSVHEKTVLLAERIGVSNEWVKRSNEQMEQLRKLLVAEPGKPANPLPPFKKDPPPLPRPRDDLHPHRVM